MSALLAYVDAMAVEEFFVWASGIAALALFLESLRVSRLAWARGHSVRNRVNQSSDDFLYTNWG